MTVGVGLGEEIQVIKFLINSGALCQSDFVLGTSGRRRNPSRV